MKRGDALAMAIERSGVLRKRLREKSVGQAKLEKLGCAVLAPKAGERYKTTTDRVVRPIGGKLGTQGTRRAGAGMV